ncbi:unnamed protein product [Bathycoccus prasinos]|mmetsp:Transcript_4257/g.13988  ORF Transcript_4257/g.13988 Transcript_4257/m.13988 type:complete len:154 (-) Transcript_4257:288-749(-)
MYISASSSLLPISATNTETRILSSAFATSSCSGRRRFSGNKNVPKSNFRDDPRGSKAPQRCFPTSASASSSSSQDSTMTPIQLQDVARKQFENRERSRAQMVERRLQAFRSGTFEPPRREKTPFNKPTPHFFSAGVMTPRRTAFLEFERLETC